MSNEDTQIITKPEQGKPYPTGFTDSDGFAINSVEDAYRMAGIVLQAGWAPKGVETREAIVIAWQHGAELGLGKMSSLQNLAIINGRPSLWGDVMLGLVMGTGLVEDRQEWWEINDQALKDSRGNFRKPRAEEAKAPSCTAFFMIKRKGIPTPTVQSFSWSDALQAGYDKKDGPWKTNPTRMIQMRARGFGLRDAFPDTLKGVMTREEAQDIPAHQGFENAKVVSPIFPEPAGKTPMAKEKPKVIEAPAKEVVAPAAVVDKKPEPVAATEPAKETVKETPTTPTAASTTASTPSSSPTQAGGVSTDDEKFPSWKKIKDAMETYDITEADVIAFAKDKGCISARNRMPFDDLPGSVLGMIVSHLPALIAKFTTEAAR